MFGNIKKFFKSKKSNACDVQEDFKLAKKNQQGSCGCDDGCGCC